MQVLGGSGGDEEKQAKYGSSKRRGYTALRHATGYPPPLPSPMTPNEPGLTHKGTQRSASAFGQAKVLECE